MTWRIQVAGWQVVYEPNAIVWILMPETLRGLWKQRLRWAEGGVQMMEDYFWPMLRGRAVSLLPIYLNYVASVIWSYVMLGTLGVGLLWLFGLHPPVVIPGFRLVPEWWGLTLSLTYLAQALVSQMLEGRYERGMLRSLFWVIWFPLAFWLLTTGTTVRAVPRALGRKRNERTTWVSPDRGLR